MSDTGSNAKKYIVVFALGAAGGGLLAAWATNAMPKMMSRVMQNMMARMREEGCDPREM
jgi:hypothetical protein